MNSQMLQALLTARRRGIASLRNHPPGGAGTLADPGTASPLGPTIPMRIGATLNPMLERVQDIFPKDNPYGSFIERLIVGDSPERTRNMKEGYPHQYTGAGPNDPIIRPQIVDLAGALPIGSAATLAKAAAPLAVPAAMATGAAALNRLKAPGYAATSTDDLGAALLGQRLQHTGALDDAMVTYQGSPHKFDALDPTKIGTGENAQAFGHGMYVAENPRVAKGYQKVLSGGGFDMGGNPIPPRIFEIDGKSFDSQLPFSEVEKLTIRQRAAYAIASHDGSAANVLADIDEFGDELKIKQYLTDAINAGDNSIYPKMAEGYLYEIDVPDEDVAKMLDWDALLSEQPQSVRENMGALQAKLETGTKHLYPLENKTGRDIYHELSGFFSDKEASSILEKAGIPGIKYYDQGSRAAGDGTRNMVLFDDLAKRAKVLKRNDETIAEPSVDEFIGGLLDDELPLDEASRMHEATFGEDLYHGTVADIDEFEVSDLGVHLGTQDAANVRLSDKEATRSGVSRYKTRNQDFGESANILPVRTSAQNPLRMDDAGEWRDPSSVITELRTSELMSKNPKLHERLLDMQDEADKLHESYAFGDLGSEGWYESPEAAEMLDEIRKMIEAEGYDSIKYTNFIESRGKNADSTIVLNPKNIRSKFAKFDPAKKDSAKLLAGAAGAGVLSGLYEPDALKDDEKMRRALLRN